jgi:hypothetical protein
MNQIGKMGRFTLDVNGEYNTQYPLFKREPQGPRRNKRVK